MSDRKKAGLIPAFFIAKDFSGFGLMTKQTDDAVLLPVQKATGGLQCTRY
jgi:hypothetical protein